METKQCSKCGEIKQLDRFYKRGGGRIGQQSYCKDCYRELDNTRHGRVGTQALPPNWDLPGEEWRTIPGYENLYQASSLGRIRSLNRSEKSGRGYNRIRHGKILRPSATDGGYLGVQLCKEGTVSYLRIHRLVALTFIGPPPSDKHDVHHIDTVTANNNSTNLEYLQETEHVKMHNAAKTNAGKCKDSQRHS